MDKDTLFALHKKGLLTDEALAACLNEIYSKNEKNISFEEQEELDRIEQENRKNKLIEENRKKAEENRRKVAEIEKKYRDEYIQNEHEKQMKNMSDFLRKMVNSRGERVYSNRDINEMSYVEIFSLYSQITNNLSPSEIRNIEAKPILDDMDEKKLNDEKSTDKPIYEVPIIEESKVEVEPLENEKDILKRKIESIIENFNACKIDRDNKINEYNINHDDTIRFEIGVLSMKIDKLYEKINELANEYKNKFGESIDIPAYNDSKPKELPKENIAEENDPKSKPSFHTLDRQDEENAKSEENESVIDFPSDEEMNKNAFDSEDDRHIEDKRRLSHEESGKYCGKKYTLKETMILIGVFLANPFMSFASIPLAMKAINDGKLNIKPRQFIYNLQKKLENKVEDLFFKPKVQENTEEVGGKSL